MDYLKLAREAYECVQEVQSSSLAEEYRRDAEVCALIAIAEQLCRRNDSQGNASLAFRAKLAERGYAPPV